MNPAISSLALILGLTVALPVPAQTDCAGTRAVLQLRVTSDALEALLNREVPKRMEGRSKFDTSLLRDEYLTWSMRRSPITLVTENNRLRAYTTITGSVRVKGKVPGIGTDFSAGPDFTVDANVTLQPVLNSAWRLHPNASVNARVTRAIAKILGVDVSVRTRTQEALDSYLSRMEEQINGRIANSTSLQREVERVWKGAHRVERISNERLPEGLAAWGVVRPTRIAATNPRATEAGIDFGVSVFGETDLVFGDEPQRTGQSLPPLEIVEDLPDGRIELALPVYADWNTVNVLIATGLEKQEMYETSYSRLKVTDAELSSGPGESVLVSAAIVAEPKGFIGWILYFIQRVLGFVGIDTNFFGNYGKHVVEMSVRPEMSEDGRRVFLRNARLMPRSGHLMETLAASYYGLTVDTIRETVEKHAVADLSAQLARAEEVAQAEVDRFSRKLDGWGVKLNVEIQPVTRFASVSAVGDGLIARFCAAADINAEVRSFGF